MSKKIILFNPSISTMNEGDHIIFDCISRETKKMFPDSKFYELPTQMPVSKRVLNWFKDIDLRFLCGTNILQSEMIYEMGWHLPHFRGIRQWDIDLFDIGKYSPVILFGCGWRKYQQRYDKLSAKVWKKLLNTDYMHSVRDEYTKNQLIAMGIKNVINTGCPTVWDFTEEFCETIPKQKAENVVTTITDYGVDIKNDQKMLDILSKNYDTVYLWLQGYADDLYIKQLSLNNNIKLIYGGLKDYDLLLSSEISLEYVGTRLHGGIRALQHKRRTTFISIDNRTIEMGKNLNFNVINRTRIDDLVDFLIKDHNCEIHIPQKDIQQFKSQF